MTTFKILSYIFIPLFTPRIWTIIFFKIRPPSKGYIGSILVININIFWYMNFSIVRAIPKLNNGPAIATSISFILWLLKSNFAFTPNGKKVISFILIFNTKAVTICINSCKTINK